MHVPIKVSCSCSGCVRRGDFAEVTFSIHPRKQFRFGPCSNRQCSDYCCTSKPQLTSESGNGRNGTQSITVLSSPFGNLSYTNELVLVTMQEVSKASYGSAYFNMDRLVMLIWAVVALMLFGLLLAAAPNDKMSEFECPYHTTSRHSFSNLCPYLSLVYTPGFRQTLTHSAGLHSHSAACRSPNLPRKISYRTTLVSCPVLSPIQPSSIIIGRLPWSLRSP
jgi:hypothetical protein